MWVWKFLWSFLCIASWCPVVCLPKASSKSAAMITCICMRSFLRLLCAFGMAGLLAVDVFFFFSSFYPFHWWKQFSVREATIECFYLPTTRFSCEWALGNFAPLFLFTLCNVLFCTLIYFDVFITTNHCLFLAPSNVSAQPSYLHPLGTTAMKVGGFVKCLKGSF